MGTKRRRRLPAPCKGHRGRLLGLLIAVGLLQAAGHVATVLLVRYLVDHFLHTGRNAVPAPLLLPAAALGACALLDGWLQLVERVRAEQLGQEYVREVRGALFTHMHRLAPRALRGLSQGGLLLRFLGDMTPLRQWLSLGVARIAVACTVLPIGLGALACLSWQIGAGVAAVFACAAVALAAGGRDLRRTTRDVRRKRARLATNVSERLAAAAVTVVHHQGRREGRRLRRQGGALLRAALARARALGRLRASSRITGGFATLCTLLIGIELVGARAATPGMVVAAMAFTHMLVPRLDDLANVLGYWHGARVARERLQSFLDQPVLGAAGGKGRRRIAGRGEVRFDGVFVDGALAGVDATAAAGGVTAIQGPNGSGKSTLLALAAGVLDPDRGRVLLDGEDLTALRKRDVRRAIGMVAPELPLLRGSLRRNLAYRCPSVEQDEFDRVCALCGVDEIVARLPRGLETRLREGGLGLSLGERQRVALARALMGTPDVLLLDEIDANLDTQALGALERVLAHFPGTVLLATHDARLAQAADVVWRLDDGRLVGITDTVLAP
jgi:ABC-type multidrug transport system fused ATPase/permease subunit